MPDTSLHTAKTPTRGRPGIHQLPQLFSGWLSDKLGGRKWLAVAGYGLSAVTKPFFYFASSWGLIAGVRYFSGNCEYLYNAILGMLTFPASVIAGLLWQGIGNWKGFGPSAPFLFGGILALIAALLMAFWMPRLPKLSERRSA